MRRFAASAFKCFQGIFGIPQPVESQTQIVADAAVLRIDVESLQKSFGSFVEFAVEIPGNPQIIVNRG